MAGITYVVTTFLALLVMCSLQAAMCDGVDKQKHAPSLPSPGLLVEGAVFCQGCKFVGTGLLAHAKPLPGAKVKLVCRSGFGRHSNFFSASAFTDFHGSYRFFVPHFNFHLFVPHKHCAVFLVFSPSRTCNTPTNIHFGLSGAPLRFKKSFGGPPVARYYVAPLAFAPAPCKRPPVVVVDHFPAPPPN